MRSDYPFMPVCRLNGIRRLWQGLTRGQGAGEALDQAALHWWERKWVAAALVLLSAVPLLWPDIPPLVDLPGHMGRYRVQLDLASSPVLQQYYSFEWALIGNLGVDLLVVPLSKLMPLEAAVKLIVVAIPPLTVAGFLWVAREVHGRIPPTAYFAVPLAYNYPFIYGFANFALSMAFAFLAFALWLRLARLGRFRLRAILFLPISCLIWTTHTYGWGALGVMAYSAELVRQHDRGRDVLRSAVGAAIHCLPLAPPAAMMLLWRNGHVGGETGDWFNMRAKISWLVMALRDRWQLFDIGSLIAILMLIVVGIRSSRLGFSRNLAASALFLLLVYLLLPRIVFGSAFADMRLVPYMLAVALIAIRFPAESDFRFARAFAVAALLFVGVRTAATSYSFWLYDRSYDRELAAIEHIPQGARLVSFVGMPCGQPWSAARLEHLPAIALVRRQAFSNDQWTMAGAQLARAIYPAEPGFRSDPSQIVLPARCPSRAWRSIDDSLRSFPREAFDYVWLIEAPPHDPLLLAGMERVWSDGDSALYRIARSEPTAQ